MALKQVYKKIMPRGLLGRSLMIIVTPLILTMGITLFVFFDRHWSTTTERLTLSLAGEISFVVDQIEQSETPDDIIMIENSVFRKFDFKLNFRPKTQLKKEQKENWLSFFKPHLKKSLISKDLQNFTIETYNTNRDWVEITVPAKDGLATFTIPEKRIFSSTTYVLLLVMIGGGFFLMVIAILFMRNQVRPVRRLAIAAERLGKGEDVNRFKAEGAREVRQAAEAFLVMRERIKRQIRQRTEMLAGVSHDLRTPLTRLKLQLEILDDTDDIIEMKKDIASMQDMIDGYLAFARGDDDEETIIVNLKDILQTCVDKALKHGAQIDFDKTQSDINLRLRQNAITRLFDNLISNAEKYADTCWVSVNPLPNAVEIFVEDNGPGIPQEKHDDVFKPFFRVDPSRNSETGGVGLGLSIALDIAHSHGGDMRLEQSGHGGLKTVVRLPL